jgi:glyoxylase I family protein
MTTRLHISGLVHVNINVSDFERSRTFYEALGFRLIWRVPETNSPEVAAAVGMAPYRVKGGLMALEGARSPLVIDLLQWVSPSDAAAPYPHLYHRGLARIALATTDMDADLKALEALGAELVGPPARVEIDGVATGGRFVCFKDPDGTILELVESQGAGDLLRTGAATSEPTS